MVGAPRMPLRDVYHAFLRARWPVAIGAIVAFYLALNAVFALVYVWVGGSGGVHDARRGDRVRRRVLLQRADDGDHRVRGRIPGVAGRRT